MATWQPVQERRNGGILKVPARQDLSEDFPLRGFVARGHCGEPLTACWSKGRSARYRYYLCDTRGCEATRRSIRRDVIEGEFETLLQSLRPSEGLLNLAFHMFRDLCNAKLHGARNQGSALKKELQEVERKLEQLLGRIVDATSGSFIAVYEKQIKELETQKALMRERVENRGRPLKSFGETYRTAFDFLANPCKL